ncbi:MAG: amidohydrolase family protein [Pseudonocardia sp.]|nr:amidohydrolase family protein [Pseudonocardia sp.]
MAERLLVRGGHVVDPTEDVDGPCDVLIEGGRVSELAPGLAPAGARVLDAEGALVLPGLVDSHVHLAHPGNPGGPRTPAYERLARAGVTTAVEFFDFASALNQWPASTTGLTMLGLQGIRAHEATASRGTVRDEIATALRGGAIGVKLFGGHFPNTPETSARVIAESNDFGAYCAFHAGTTRFGSNLDGMREAIELADGNPLHIAHTNAYLRGATDGVDLENRTAIDLLWNARRVVSEAHLAEFNVCLGSLTGGALDDKITVNCLRLGGFPANATGLEEAFLTGFAHVLHDTGGEPAHITGERGLRLWRADPAGTMLNFPVNNRLSAFLQSCARMNADGRIGWDGDGEFVVDAISSDGGSWRNVILRHGFALQRFGALTMSQFVDKACGRPARLFGLTAKGRLGPGADGDVAVVEPHSARVRYTIAGGRVVFDGDQVALGGGKVLTTAEGVPAIVARGIDCEVVDLGASTFRTRISRMNS